MLRSGVPTDLIYRGSGGGFRALIGVLGYTQEMKASGLWDLLTYVAGVSGACWALAAYYTFGEASVEKVIENCKQRFHPHHPLSAEAIRNLLSRYSQARNHFAGTLFGAFTSDPC